MVINNNHIIKSINIISNEEISEGIYFLIFRRTFEFKAGQVIGISLEQKGARRLYSICSGEEEDEIRIIYNVVEEGYLTPRLSDLGPGDTIWITGPRGEFTCDKGPAVWIATGTGIAPFCSMLRSGLGENKMLIHGERYLEQFHFYEDFDRELRKNYIRCCSGEEAPDVFSGRVTDFLDGSYDLDPALKYYLCGSAEMVVESRDILIKKGIPFSRIISEIYF